MTESDSLAAIVRELAPQGAIRAAINVGNPVLARRDPDGGDPSGISVDLAFEVGRRLQVPVRLAVFEGAGAVFDAVDRNEWDLAFLAIEPVRAARIAFTAPYITIEGTYLVRADASFREAVELDQPGHRIAVIEKAAYDLFLTRTLRHATLVRRPAAESALELTLKGQTDATAGVRQALDTFARGRGDVRVMADRFMQIEQAMAVPASKTAAAAYLKTFIADAMASGFVARAIARNT